MDIPLYMYDPYAGFHFTIDEYIPPIEMSNDFTLKYASEGAERAPDALLRLATLSVHVQRPS